MMLSTCQRLIIFKSFAFIWLDKEMYEFLKHPKIDFWMLELFVPISFIKLDVRKSLNNISICQAHKEKLQPFGFIFKKKTKYLRKNLSCYI